MAYNPFGEDVENFSGAGSSEEERKRRLAMMAGLAGGGSFTDLMSNYATDRMQGVQDKLQGVQLTQPMGPVMPESVAQERQANPQQFMPQQPQQPVQPTYDMGEFAGVDQAVEEQKRQQAQMPTPISPDQVQLPQPGPGVQVASTQPGAGVSEAAQATQQPVQQPAWVQEANNAGTDFNKLLDVMSKYPESRQALSEKVQAAMTRKSREDEANELIKRANNGDVQALNKIQQALRPEKGKVREEITANDYIKAYMYNRLGLTKLGEDIQNRIIGKDTKFGQLQLNGTNWQGEFDTQTGQLVRARDSEGNIATQDTLNKLAAGGMKAGSQAYGFTGGSFTIPQGQPNAGQEYRQRTNSITGQIENVITTGPEAGQVYKGTPGFEKRVETNLAVKLNDALVDFNTKPTIAAAVKMMELAGQADQGDGKTINSTMSRIQSVSPQIFNQIRPMATEITGRPQATQTTGAADKTTATQLPGGGVKLTPPSKVPLEQQPTVAPQRSPFSTVTPPTGGGGGSLLQQVEGQKAAIDLAKDVAAAEQKPPAEAKGKVKASEVKNQQFADSTYDLIKPISEAIKSSTGSGIGTKVDQLANKIGASTKGQEAIAQLEVLSYPILSNVPRFEGAQSDIDVKNYQKAAGDFANSEKPVQVRLAALQAMVSILKKYDKEGKNDWTFGEGQSQSGNKTSTGVTWKKVP